MTTFTRIPEGDTPSISVDVLKRLAKIDDNIYGGFTEHMGRCIYGGIYDPGNTLSDSHGYRLDVLDALRELNLPVIRYPGGNFCATYHWEDGVGPRATRRKRPDLAWGAVESNEFGTDEFMHWLSVLGKGREKRVEPYFCLNMGTGTLDEALAWVEYCNGTQDTYYANLRRQNGHEEPYNIKYWSLGNELWGDWQVGQMTEKAYAEKALQWAKALRFLDPAISLILCGNNGLTSWDFTSLMACIPHVTMHSIHCYTYSKTHIANAFSPLQAEAAIQSTASMINVARIANNIPPTVPQTKICFDEWNVWDQVGAKGESGAEQLYTLSDALAVGVWLNVFVRQSKYVGMANIAQTVNVISPLTTSPTGLFKQTTWWPLYLFSTYMRGWTIGCHVRGEAYEGATEPGWLQAVLGEDAGASYLDVSACVDELGFITLAVVNAHETKDFRAEIIGSVLKGKGTKVFTISGPDVKAVNTQDKEVVSVKESTWDGAGGKFVFGKHSLTMLRWETKEGKAAVKEVESKVVLERNDARVLAWGSTLGSI